MQNTGTTDACEFSNDVACKMLFVGCEPCGHFTEHTSNSSKLTLLSLLSYLAYPWFSTWQNISHELKLYSK